MLGDKLREGLREALIDIDALSDADELGDSAGQGVVDGYINSVGSTITSGQGVIDA